jgi:signal transduction histidine kinase
MFSIRFRSLTTQLILVVVLPVLALMTIVVYGGVSLHEDAMRKLVSERDQRAVNAIAAALAGTTDLSRFDRMAQATLTDPGARLIVLSADGTVIRDTTGQRVATVDEQTGQVTPHDLTTHQAESGETNLVTTSAIVPGAGWTIILQESWAAVANPILKLSLIAPMLAIPALVLAIGVLAYGAYSIVVPLRRLKKLAARVSWGNYEMNLQSVGGVQEIRDLQTSLSLMARRLHDAQSAVQSYIGATLQGQEEERKRLARELHDDTLQSLIALDQKRQMARRALERDPDKVIQHLDDLHTLTDETIASLRRLLRDMRPSYIEDLGLSPALEALTAQTAEKTDSAVQFTTRGTPKRLPPFCELALYRVVQEALNNAVRHANASVIRVTLCFGEQLQLSIQDNGKGFAVPERPQIFAREGHYGLMGIVERTEQIKGQFAIDSRPGKGTTITVTLPNPEATTLFNVSRVS